MRQKSYVVDTSVLIYNPDIINEFKDNLKIVREVLLEIDYKAKKDIRARKVKKYLKDLFLKNQEGLLESNSRNHTKKNKNGGEITLYLNTSDEYSDQDFLNHAGIKIENKINHFSKHFTDYMIINACKKTESTLLSRDYMMLITALQFNVPAQEYTKKTPLFLNSQKNILLPDQKINKLYSQKLLDYSKLNYDYDLKTNQFLNLKGENNSALSYFSNNKIKLITNRNFLGIKSINKEQSYVMSALANRSIDLVCLTGPAGTGKTLLSLAYSLYQVKKKENYKKIILLRPTVSNKKENIGFLPGNVEEKIKPWLKPIFDNLEIIFNQSPEGVFNSLVQKKQFEVEALQFLRGRSLKDCIVLVDEAQNLDKGQMKKIITRASSNTKIIITGDISQIDSNSLNEYNNGLLSVINSFLFKDNFAHIDLKKNERSLLAQQASKFL